MDKGASWKTIQLGEFISLQRGFDLTARQRRLGSIPVMGSAGQNGFHNKALVNGPGVVLGRSGNSFGKAHYVEQDYWPHNTAMFVTDFHGNDPLFAYYFLLAFDFDQFNTGGAQPSLNRNHIYPIEISIPNRPEQEAIAEALGDVDGLLAGLERLIAKKRAVKTAVMQELLTGRRRLPGFFGRWEAKRIGDFAEIYQPQTISANAFTSEGYPVYGANGIVGFYHDYNHETWQTTITCRGSTCGTVNRTMDYCWITGNAMVINCDLSKEVDKPFLYYLLSNQDFTATITGTGQPQIVRRPLSDFELSMPSKLDEQQAIATVLSDIDAEITALAARRAKTHAIKQGMMQELLTGRTRLID